MGATLQDVAPSIIALVLQSLVYFIWAVMVYRYKLTYAGELLDE
jgi:hypothetical protein